MSEILPILATLQVLFSYGYSLICHTMLIPPAWQHRGGAERTLSWEPGEVAPVWKLSSTGCSISRNFANCLLKIVSKLLVACHGAWWENACRRSGRMLEIGFCVVEIQMMPTHLWVQCLHFTAPGVRPVGKPCHLCTVGSSSVNEGCSISVTCLNR